jgi:hypothetical protein
MPECRSSAAGPFGRRSAGNHGCRGEVVTDSTDEGRRADTREPLGADFIIPLMSCGLAGYYLATTTDLVWEARAAGVAVGVPLILMCVFHMGRTLYRIFKGDGSFGFGEIFANTQFNRQRLALGLLTAAFIAALPWTGTTLGLFLVLIAGMWTLGVTSIRQLVGIAAITAAVVYVLLIYFVSSRLPQGPVEWLIARIFGIGG